MLRHPWYPAQRRFLLHRLSAAYMDRWQLHHRQADLDRAVSVTRQLAAESPDDDWLVQADLGGQLHMRFQEQHVAADLDEAIRSCRAAMDGVPADQTEVRARQAARLGRLLALRHTGTDTAEAITRLGEAVESLETAGDAVTDPELRGDLLEALAQAYMIAYQRTYADRDRRATASAAARAVAATPSGSPDRRMRQFLLGSLLSERTVEGIGQDEAVAALEAAYDGGSPLGTDPAAVGNLRGIQLQLGYVLATRAAHRSSVEEAARAADLLRGALDQAVGDALSTAARAFLAASGLVMLLDLDGATSLDEVLGLARSALAALRASDVGPYGIREQCAVLVAELLLRRHDHTGQRSDMRLAGKELRSVIGDPNAPATARFAAASMLGTLAAGQGEWRSAVAALDQALNVSKRLFRVQAVAEGKDRVLALRGSVPMDAAYARSRIGEIKRAVLLVEVARAMALSEALSLDRADLGSLAVTRPDLARRFRAAASRLRVMESDWGDPQAELIHALTAVVAPVPSGRAS